MHQGKLPLLQALIELGGEAKAAVVYPVVTAKFPNIDPEDLSERLSSGHCKWTNRVQWVRQKLVDKGQVDSGGWGVWQVTAAGRARVAAHAHGEPDIVVPSTNLQAIWDEYEEAFKGKALDRLQSLTPLQFEHFGREFLRTYGFVKVEVTNVGADGGIDGHGELKVGLATMQVAFQCKRWKGNVPRPEIDKFRGATQGAYEQGIFFTTSDFTKDAKGASIKRGAIPIVLLNGAELVEVMVARGLGVKKRPIYLFEEVPIPGVEEDD